VKFKICCSVSRRLPDGITGIYEADRPAIEAALTKPGSNARNERRALSIRKFTSIGRKV